MLGAQLSVATTRELRANPLSHSPPPVPMSSIVVPASISSATMASRDHGGGSSVSRSPSSVKFQPRNGTSVARSSSSSAVDAAS